MRNQGVVVTLIVFIVLTLILGVFTYFGFKGLSEKKQELASAQSELSSAKSEISTLTADLTSVKTKLGYEAVSDAKQLVEQMGSDVEKALGQTEANTTYKDAVDKLGRNLAAKNVEIADYVKQRDDAVATANAEIKKSEQQKADFDKQIADIQKEHEKNLADARDSYDKLTKSFNEQTQEFDKLKSQTKDAIAAAKQETADFKESATKFAEINLDLSKRIDQLSNAEFERADAEVIYADQAAKTVRLNVGTKDGVRPLTTFNVFPYDTLDMGGAQSKGSVQVVRAIGEHVCEAKILEDEMSNPIQQGDLVYTPLWRPGDVVRYALDYHLDINKDGLSDLDEIINLIQSSGAEVAAFIDDQGVTQGKITPDVFRVVVADESILDVLAKDFTLDDAAKQKMQRSEQDFLDSAKANGVQQIRLADFLVKIGYKETAQISRYREEGGVSLQENGVPKPEVSPGVVAPIYRGDADHAVVSPGTVARTYVKDAEKAPVSSGNVSGYYFRERSPNGK